MQQHHRVINFFERFTVWNLVQVAFAWASLRVLFGGQCRTFPQAKATELTIDRLLVPCEVYLFQTPGLVHDNGNRWP